MLPTGYHILIEEGTPVGILG